MFFLNLTFLKVLPETKFVLILLSYFVKSNPVFAIFEEKNTKQSLI